MITRATCQTTTQRQRFGQVENHLVSVPKVILRLFGFATDRRLQYLSFRTPDTHHLTYDISMSGAGTRFQPSTDFTYLTFLFVNLLPPLLIIGISL